MENQELEPLMDQEAPESAVSLSEATSSALHTATLEYDGEVPVIRNVVLIEAGMSANRRNYPAEMLATYGPGVFEGAPVYDTTHRKEQKTLASMVGHLRNVHFSEGKLKGDLRGFASHAAILQKAVEAEKALGSNRLGLSIDTAGELARTSNRQMQEVARLYKTPDTSVDLVINPAAKGRLTESQLDSEEGINMEENTTPEAAEEIVDAVENTQVEETPAAPVSEITEAVTAPQPEINIDEIVAAKVAEALRADAQKRMIEAKLETAKDLGETVLTTLRESLSGDESENLIDTKITALRDEIGKRSANRPNVPGGQMKIVESYDKQKSALEGMLRGKSVNGVAPYNSVLRALRDMAGIDPMDHQEVQESLNLFAFKGDLSRTVQAQEAISAGTFDQAWADALNRVVLDYARMPEFNHWRLWTEVIAFKDLTTSVKLTRVGGYGTIPTVAENGTYTALTSPADEQVTMLPVKKGGTETLSWEAILRDDVALIRDLPRKLGVAWARTVHDYIYGILQSATGNGPTMAYDSVALYNVAHANIVDAALSASAYRTARNQMGAMTELTSGKKLGLRPGFALVAAPDLEETAYELFDVDVKNTSTSDSTMTSFIARNGVQIVPVVWPTASVQRVDLVCKKEDLAAMYVGFLNGNADPEILVADDFRYGVGLTNDQIVYKIRGTVGAAPADHRAFQRIQNN